jgi:predicted DNA-binding transcriptional regulator YafY
MLPVVQDAVWRDRRLAFRYRSPGREPAERAVDPLGLVTKGSSWYLVARTPDGMRTYRVSRMERARVLERPCRRPPDFDLAEYWRSSTDRLQRQRPRYDAILRLEARAAEKLRMWRSASPASLPAPDAAGWVTLRVAFDDEDQACFVALGLGADAEVVEPAGLRRRVGAAVAAAAARLRARAKRGPC